MSEQIPGQEPEKTKEIERKFVIDPQAYRGLRDKGWRPETHPHEKIHQGYLANTPDCAIRVRRKGEKFYLTFKGAPGEHVAERVELEAELTEEQFDTMWPGTEGRRVEKTRYNIPTPTGHIIELDIFEGDNAGRILAEVEFGSTAEADAFQPPEWFGTDVTADKAYGNASIAEFGFPPDYLT